MSKKLYILLAVMVISSVVFTACVKQATSNNSLPTPTTGLASDTPAGAGPTDDPIAMLYAYATQTAIAGGGATPQPVVTDATPGGVNPTAGMPSPTATLYVVMPTLTPGPLPSSYTLQVGEYPYCIARRFDVNPEELLALNNLSDGSLYKPGLVLQIPQSGNPFPGNRALNPHPATYVVQSDDTIYAVACHYGDIDPLVIAQMNGLQPPYSLTTGSTLQIP